MGSGDPPGDPDAGTDGLVFRVRSSRRPAFSDIAAQHPAILSARDVEVAREALALARQESENDRRKAAASQPGAGPDSSASQPAPPAGSEPAAPQPPVAQPPGAPGPEARPAAPPPLPSARPAPSWGAVLATTIRLWTQRRLRRIWPATTRWRVIGTAILAAVLFCGGAITVAMTRSATGSKPARPGLATGGGPSAAELAAAATARNAAATWVAQQVAPDAIIACDPQMCPVLLRRGIPAARLLVLGAGNADPLGSDVIVSTAVVRQEFGARLGSVYAPVALASFGTGSAQTVIRVVAPDGSAAYLRELQADQASRVSAGGQLLHNARIRAAAAAGRALAAGQVDSRLLSTLAALATIYTVDVAGFGPASAGASPGMPLRTAEIMPGRRSIGHRPDTLGALAHFLRAQLPPFRPARIVLIRLASGQSVLRVEYGAPEPLGLLGKG
jgi:hypothetical protein